VRIRLASFDFIESVGQAPEAAERMTSRILAFAVSAAATLAVLAPAHADELQSVYAQILSDPTNSALNIRYAALAEARQEYRKALAA
jgi:hypothetical protein